MNPNHMPYGQPMPMQPQQRRHDGSYAPMPPHMRPHQGYQPYYPQHMGPMMPQYPQQYAPNWYQYPPQHMHPMHQPRPHYYQQPTMPPPHYPPMPVSSQPLHPHPSPRSTQTPSSTHHHGPTSISSTSTAPVQTPPSPPLSTSTTVSARKDFPSQPASPAPQRVRSPSNDPVPESERFFPPTPWLSFDGDDFPSRAPRQKRRIARSQLANEPVIYPVPEVELEPETLVEKVMEQTTPKAEAERDEKSAEPPSTPTPLPSDTPSEDPSTQPTTPASSAPTTSAKSQQTPTQPKTRPTGQIVPVIPALPQSPTAMRRAHRDSTVSTQSKASEDASAASLCDAPITSTEVQELPGSNEIPPAPAIPKAKPTSWASLLRPAQAANAASMTTEATQSVNGAITGRGEALADALNDMSISSEVPSKISFLQPRGLVNTGNMCYMNSVLQVLVFSIPFYDLISRVARRSAHTFKSDTPLIDAIILFIQEYDVLDTAVSAEQLRLRLKPDDYEKYGDSFIPEYVYSAIKQLPRFKEMRRGHQQDAQEFLGFLLEELHEECARSMKSGTSSNSGRSTPVGSVTGASEPNPDSESGWMEVGHKQKPAVTRSSGGVANESPITNIFGGKLRSELKVSGNKLSVTLEPYSPLQLDIGSPEVSNILDALKGLTRPESMQGEFQTARGQRTTATKQVFIETLPPVLILHLKRFQYDNSTKRAEKIWKKVGYPLELEIPKEVFPLAARNKFVAHGGLPKYRLTGVIYHHGKNANGGHYTVDIRRQDGKEWIRLDDTLIRRIRSEEVAEGGSEEDPKVLAAALERHKQGNGGSNRFEQIEQDEEEAEPDSKAWSQVNGHSRSKSTITAMVNGTATPAKSSGPQTPREKYSIKDNKVAYLLFYQRITA